MRQTKNHWTYENCMEESKKYKSRSEFCKGNGSAYNVARKNGWLDEYTWFKRLVKPNGYWDYERCMEESKKYISRGEFSNGCSRAYEVARKNGWLNDYTWLESKFHADWTYETCMEESRNYTTRSEFCKGNGSAYNVARKNGWVDEYTWLKDERFDLYKDNIDSVYVYEFKEFNCAYVGRTLMRCKRKRDIAHIFHTDNDAVAKFAKEHNISVPEPIYLEENLTLEDGAKQEEYWLNKYKEDGWTMLNSAKTGSIGALGKGKWNKKTCMEESKKFKSRSEFQKGSKGAYLAARRNGWLDEYTWFKRLVKPNGYWDYERCMEESKKYMSRGEFQKGNRSAYKVALKNGWLDDFTWLELKFHADWTYETCMEESKKYNTRNEFKKGSNGAYQSAYKNGWLNDYTWFEDGRIKWTYETCMKESKKYNTRNEFKKGNRSAYEVARKNGWLNDYTWLESKFHADWTYETCMEESKKYNTRNEFKKGCSGAYYVARKNGWVDDFFPKCNDLAMAA